jgi:single-strand DNA-binding protein
VATLNRVMLIGRLTRDPEGRDFQGGGRVAKFGFAVNNRKKNQNSGEWEDVPVFLDCEAFSRQEGRKLADLVLQHLKKGSQVYVEGALHLDEWADKKTGEKRSKLKVVVGDIQFLDAKAQGEPGTPAQGQRGGPPQRQQGRPPQGQPVYREPENYDNDEPIPY